MITISRYERPADKDINLFDNIHGWRVEDTETKHWIEVTDHVEHAPFYGLANILSRRGYLQNAKELNINFKDVYA